MRERDESAILMVIVLEGTVQSKSYQPFDALQAGGLASCIRADIVEDILCSFAFACSFLADRDLGVIKDRLLEPRDLLHIHASELKRRASQRRSGSLTEDLLIVKFVSWWLLFRNFGVCFCLLFDDWLMGV